MNTSYPSISSTAGKSVKKRGSLTSIDHAERSERLFPSSGSATRNSSDIVDALRPSIERSIRRTKSRKTRFLELASGTGEHLEAYAAEWKQVEWIGSERDGSSVSNSSPTGQPELSTNLIPPVKLDVLEPSQWDELETFLLNRDSKTDDAQTSRTSRMNEEPRLDGVVDGIIINNLLHCAPHPETSHAVFKHASLYITQEPSIRDDDQAELDGWVSVYGAFKRDDGDFASEGDKKFDERFRGLHETFGLRTVGSIEEVAKEYGWEVKEIKEMKMGNRMIFFGRCGEAKGGRNLNAK